MSENKNNKKNMQAKRRRRRGVPGALVALLLCVTLFFGGLVGFWAANKTNTYQQQLTKAEERITELENLLTMMGFSEGLSDPDDFVFDDTNSADELGDMIGEKQDDASVLWDEDGLAGSLQAQEGEPVVVAEFEGGQLLSSEVIEPYNDQLATEAFGFGNADESSGSTLQTVMEILAADKICYQKAESLGLTTLNDADHAAIREIVDSYYQEQKDFYRDSVNTTGMTREEADAAVDQFLKDEIGVDRDEMLKEETEGYWRVKLFDEVTKGVTAAPEEVQAAYDALLADQKTRFTDYPEDYEFAIMAGETIAYNLEGYRYVKHILLTFDDPDVATAVEDLYYQISLLSPETDLEQITALQQQLDAHYADLDAQADAIIAELNAGADFEDLIARYGEDEAVNYEPVKSLGYTVSANSFNLFSPDFIEGCMMLENVGDVSVPVHSVGGVHIIKYVGEAKPGEVPLSDIRPILEAEVLAEKQEASYIEQEAQWIAEANVKYYPERLQ